MRQVVENTVAAFATGQISIAGPPLSISPKMALTMALAINELGTNALKYGALSTTAGQVAVTWSLDPSKPADGLTWQWLESGGPPVIRPARRGFGTFLIERVLATDFGGTVRLDYETDGLECVLTAPIPQPAPAQHGSA